MKSNYLAGPSSVTIIIILHGFSRQEAELCHQLSSWKMLMINKELKISPHIIFHIHFMVKVNQSK